MITHFESRKLEEDYFILFFHIHSRSSVRKAPMAQTFGFEIDKVKSIIGSNNAIKRTTRTYVTDFLSVQEEFQMRINELYHRLGTVEYVADIFPDKEKMDILTGYQPLDEAQLAVCGYNNTGKTSFIHELLGFGDFLPANEGPITARIVKFSYAPSDAACLIEYASVKDCTVIQQQKSLSDCFATNLKEEAQTKKLKKRIWSHLARPKDMDKFSDAFAVWAKIFVEIRIPSPILGPGLHIYDTPGFLKSDPPVLCENLLELVRTVYPTLLFLYDNAAVSGNSRECYEKLKEALRSKSLGVDIFFLNMKADVAAIRKNARNRNDTDNDDDDDDDNEDDETILKKERLYRYELLLQVDEMKGDINDPDKPEQAPPLEKCQCFDIFTTYSTNDPMEKIMKRQAIDRIVHFAAEHDLRLTKRAIHIVHGAIDTFFDFVLITNRRSLEEWKMLREEALQWGNRFFRENLDIVSLIAGEAKRCLPDCFHKKYDNIKERVLKNCETGSESVDDPGSSSKDPKVYKGNKFIDMLIEREVIRPVIQQIIFDSSEHIKQSLDTKNFLCYRNKNELLYAAYRQFLVDIGAFDGRMSDINVDGIIVYTILSPLLLIGLRIFGVLVVAAVVICFPELVFEGIGGIIEHTNLSAEEKAARKLACQKKKLSPILLGLRKKYSSWAMNYKRLSLYGLKMNRQNFRKK